AEDVAGQAFGMQPYQHVLLSAHLALDQSHVLDAVELRAVAVDGELAMAGRQARLGSVLDHGLTPLSPGDQILDADQRQALGLRKALEFRTPHHATVVVDQLAEDADRLQPRQPRQVYSRFRMAGPAQDAAVLGAQREDM